MMKKMLMGTIAGASLLALVGAANAEVNINIYGASAQYDFWNAAAKPFLETQGCTNVEKATNSAKHGITRGDCNGERVNIRYSAKASFDGIRSMQGIDPDNVDTCDSEGYSNFYRKMADEANTNFSTGLVNGTKCVDVTIGASDVAATTFKQQSAGNLNGHLGGGRVTRIMDSTTIYDDGLTAYRPVCVPFAFFANNTVPINNVSRVMATAIFSGKISNWNELDPDYASQDVIVLLRHAGSGTHATLDAAVMRGDSALIPSQPSINNINPIRWFYEGSSGVRDALAALAGSIGYMDADQTVAANVKQLSYEGEMATREAIAYGRYSFWSAQWLYEDPDEPDYTNTHPWVVALDGFASDATNLTNYMPAKAAFWATQGELQVIKLNDFQLPEHK